MEYLSSAHWVMLSHLSWKCMWSMCWCSIMEKFSLWDWDLLNISAKPVSYPGVYCIV